MNTNIEFRVLESISGTGKVHEGERFIADVNYSIKEVEEVFSTGSSERITGQRTIFGIVESPLTELLISRVGERLTLHLQDGRAFDFAITRRQGKNSCLIKSLGNFLAAS